jgi:EAL domain-containing protein (putative c-di-GMP-specific phosphodiesterase class I)
MTVVAEGVETAEQLEFLNLHGCDEIQGFYFSRPIDAHSFEQFMTRHNFAAVNRLGVL